MIYGEDFTPDEIDEFEGEADYPVVFGITFTPQVAAIAMAIAGLVLGLYILFNFFMPSYSKYQKLKQETNQKQDTVDQQQLGTGDRGLVKIEDQLREAQSVQSQVLALFSNEQTLDTLLLNISQLVRARDVKILSFEPESSGLMVVQDSSFGAEVNGKIKRQRVEVQLEGNFQNTQGVLQDIERLQSLLIVKNANFSSDTGQPAGTVVVNVPQNTAKVIPKPNQIIQSSFTLEIIASLTPEELKQIAAQEADEEQKKEQNQ